MTTLIGAIFILFFIFTAAAIIYRAARENLKTETTDKAKENKMNTETLGAAINIKKTAKMGKAPATINMAVHAEKPTEFYEVLVGIGKDHVAYLYIDEHALAELRKESPSEKFDAEINRILGRRDRGIFDLDMIASLNRAVSIVNESLREQRPSLKILHEKYGDIYVKC